MLQFDGVISMWTNQNIDDTISNYIPNQTGKKDFKQFLLLGGGGRWNTQLFLYNITRYYLLLKS